MERAESFPSLLLHALEPGDAEKEYAPSQAQRVEEALPLEQVEPWVAAYCHDPTKPVKLTRRLPHSHLWYTVLSKQRTIASLNDEEVMGMKSLIKGGLQHNTQRGSPGAHVPLNMLFCC